MTFTYLPRSFLRYLPLALLIISSITRAVESDIKVSSEADSNNGVIKQIELNPQIAQMSVGGRIRFTIPNDRTLTFEVSSVKNAYNNSKVISARSNDNVSLLLTMDDKASFGNIRGDNINYSISHSKETGQVLVDQNDESFPTIDLTNDAMIPPGMSAKSPGYLQMDLGRQINEQVARKEADSVVTIMVLYSNEFANGFSSPSARVNQLLAFTNQSFARSGINIELKLAHARAFDFNNDTSVNTLLSQITNGSGSFSSVADLRDRFGADMVALLPFRNGFSSSGVAWVNGGNQRFAYSVTRLSPNCCDSVFAHEIGHNLGSGHERTSANPNQRSPCTFNFVDFACGHANTSNNWGTIMSALNSARVNHVFSNPDLNCLGSPCGVSPGQTNEADNRSAFNITGPLVAAFRASNNTATMPPIVDLILNGED